MKKTFTPNDIKDFDYLSCPIVSPGGKRIAYVVRHADEDSGSFPPTIWLYDVENGETRKLTDGDQPTFLADGSIVYLGSDGQIHLISPKWENKKLTSLRHGVKRFSISRDRKKLAFEATLWPYEKKVAFSEMTDDERAAWDKELEMTPYFITELTYKMDEWYGMRKGEYSHIGTVSIDGTEQRLIDTSGMEAAYPVWSPDGKRLAFYGYPHSGPKGRWAEVFTVNADGSDMKKLTDGNYISPDTPPVFTESGVVFCAYPELPDGGTSLLPFMAKPNGETICLMDADDEEVCHGVNPCVASRTVMGETPYMHLSADGMELFFLTALKGHTRICKIPVCGGRAELVLEGKTDISAFTLASVNEPVCIMGTLNAPGELWFGGKTLTAHNSWLDEFERSNVEEVTFTGRDGETRLHYFLVHPVGEETGRLYPAVLDIKGGPETMYSASYWHEFHALASAGFAVVCPNPRGSTGFGHAYNSGAICWMNGAMEDVIDCLENAISKGFIDRERVGVTGGSYGGYMTNKLIGRTKLFKAAAAQRCLINPAVSYGTGDLGFINHGSVPKDFTMLAYLEDRARGNLITYIDNIDIPVLILHGFRDYRCGFEQAEQFFVAMKDRHPDVPVRLVMFPEENHGVTRTGKLHSQIRHLDEIVCWFKKYVKGEEA